MMVLLDTARLSIRNFQSADGPALCTIIRQYVSSPVGKYDQPWPTSEDEIQGIVEWFAKGDSFLAVCLKSSGRLVGFISADRAGDQVFNLGYIFDADFHGQGLASEACQAVIAHAFQVWQAGRLVSGTAAVNAPSCRLLARLGFRKISEGRTHFQTHPDGSPIEFLGLNFELTRAEWVQGQNLGKISP